MTEPQNKKAVLTYALQFLALILAGIIFIIDIHVPLGVAMGVIYCLVIFYSWLLPGPYASMYSAAFCSMLVVLGMILSADVNVDSNMVGVNRIISLIAIWICAFLVLVAKRGLNALELIRGQLEVKVRERTKELHEKQLRIAASEKQYRTLLESAPDGMVIVDQHGKIELANNQTEKIFGFLKDELKGKPVEVLMPERFKSQHPKHVKSFFHMPKSRSMGSNMELFGMRKDGTEFPIEISLSPLIRDNGQTIVTAAIRDISGRKEMEKKLEINRRQFQNAFEYSAIGMALVSTEGHWLSVNKRLCEMIGYSQEELMKLTFQDITHPDDLESDLSQMHQLLRNEIEGYQMEKRYFHKNGQIVWVMLSVSLVRNERDEPVHFVSQIEDITKRKEAEDSLKATSERLTMATKAAKIGIWEYDFDSEKLVWDERMYQIYGVKKELFEVTYNAWQECVHKNDIKRIDKQVSRALAGEIDYYEEFRITWPNGSIHQIEAQALVLRNEKGEPKKMVGINRDVTEEKKSIRLSENNKVLKSKTQEMEQFAYVASHDLREPLLTIKNYTQLLVEDFGDQLNGEAHHFTKSIINASTRMEDLITELLDYSRLGSKTKKLVAVNCQELTETLVSDLAILIKKNEASVNIKNLPTIMAYPVELKLLFQNLIQNAIKFRKQDQQALIWVSAKKVENGFQFCVRDNGIGIEEKHLDKIFTIFKKLHKRKDYEGSGIGLAHAKKIAELHNGKIWVDSEPDKGSSFYFTILTDM